MNDNDASSANAVDKVVSSFRTSELAHKKCVERLDANLKITGQNIDLSINIGELWKLEEEMMSRLGDVAFVGAETAKDVMAKLELWYDIVCPNSDISQLSPTDLLIVSAVNDLRTILESAQ